MLVLAKLNAQIPAAVSAFYLVGRRSNVVGGILEHVRILFLVENSVS